MIRGENKYSFGGGMDKKIIIGVILMVLAGGGWLYLDYLNKQAQAEAEEMHQAMLQARAQAKARFESQLSTDLIFCRAAAEKAKTDYINANGKPVPHKRNEFTISQAVADEAARMLAAANVQCQQIYDDHLKSGL